MGLLTMPFQLPLRPLQGVIKLGEMIKEQAEREMYDPARIRRELEEAQSRRDRGEISDDELAQTEDRLTATLVTKPSRPDRPRRQRGKCDRS
ncbi:gas vesicle protein G [Trebonia kvetii]|uniref:Gas vesicle protein G n=1 Tax=Trebonia kvetii TaxID=2480626 RepID=A0A6P2BP29_9ACTN|nr:gas vesicle protein GvpG [Trebonia kvetii]TVZ00744.1 gas vesicle protein G [Trebonia kvetii]